MSAESPGSNQCPKCGYMSSSPNVCDVCGALIARIQRRGEDPAPPDFQAGPATWETPESSGSRSWLVVASLTVGVAAIAGGFWFFRMRGVVPTVGDAPAVEVVEADVSPALPLPVRTAMQAKPALNKQAAKPDEPSKGSKLFGEFVDALKSPSDKAPSASDSVRKRTDPAPAPAAAAAGKKEVLASARERPVMIEIGEDAFNTGSFGGSSRSSAGSATSAADDPQLPASKRAGGGSVMTVTSSSFDTSVLQHADSPVLVDFYATWCGPCQMLAPRVAQVAQDYGGSLKVMKLDIDANKDLAKRYNVTNLPTLLLFKNGREVKRTVGCVSADTLKQSIEPFI